MSAVVVWSVALWEVVAVQATGGDCQNPLFRVSWAGKSDIRVLAYAPGPQYGITRCLGWADRDACCPSAFEDELQAYFERWVNHWQNAADDLEDLQFAMDNLRMDQAYIQAAQHDQSLFDAARIALADVVTSYGPCFDTLLEYHAGMLCFSCDPAWRDKVLFDATGAHIARLRISESTQWLLWDACKALGYASSIFRVRFADSVLARRMQVQVPDWGIFATKIGISEFMASLALIPTGVEPHHDVVVPGVEGVDTGASDASARMLLGNGGAGTHVAGPARRSLTDASSQATTISPVEEGRNSGFQCTVFPRPPDSGAGREHRPVFLTVLLAAAPAAALWAPHL